MAHGRPGGSELLSGKASPGTDGGVAVWDARGMWGIQYIGASAYLHLYTPNSSVGDAPSARPYDRCVPTPEMPCNLASNIGYNYSHAAARSYHPGGVNVVFADGHVDFIFDVIDMLVWRRLGQIDDGHTVPVGYQDM